VFTVRWSPSASGLCVREAYRSPLAVLDGNGTDGVAAFQLPNPDPTNSGTTTYSVWARAWKARRIFEHEDLRNGRRDW
jgi:hypothetical protein